MTERNLKLGVLAFIFLLIVATMLSCSASRESQRAFETWHKAEKKAEQKKIEQRNKSDITKI